MTAPDSPPAFTYATADDLTNHLGRPAPADAAVLLAAATAEIDRLTRTAVYDTDGAGYAVDPGVRAALRDATCALVAWWDETGDPSGARALVTSASIAGVSLGFGNAGGGAASRIAPAVYTLLLNANLLGGPVMQHG